MTKTQQDIVANGRELPGAWDAGVSRSEFEDRMQKMEQALAWLEQQLTDARAELGAGLDQVFCMASEATLDSHRPKRHVGEGPIHLRSI